MKHIRARHRRQRRARPAGRRPWPTASTRQTPVSPHSTESSAGLAGVPTTMMLWW